jgi:cellulose synthase/poly-beta-1,6-N-acetylglucosamine synthase-like glycosyltransferase
VGGGGGDWRFAVTSELSPAAVLQRDHPTVARKGNAAKGSGNARTGSAQGPIQPSGDANESPNSEKTISRMEFPFPGLLSLPSILIIPFSFSLGYSFFSILLIPFLFVSFVLQGGGLGCCVLSIHSKISIYIWFIHSCRTNLRLGG